MATRADLYHPVRPVKAPTPLIRGLAVGLLFVLFMALALPLAGFTAGRIFYQLGMGLAGQGRFNRAAIALEKAARYQPGASDIEQGLGLVYLQTVQGLAGSLRYLIAARALDHFQRARTINPLEPEAAYGLARAAELTGEQGRATALAAYREAIRLWPSNPLYHTAMARELAHQGLTGELLTTVRTLGRIDPAGYSQLQREYYWSEDMADAYGQGLDQAIALRIAPRQALQARAGILARQGRWHEAAVLYEKGLLIEEFRNGSREYYQLARLLLRSGEYQQAFSRIITGLGLSQTREKDLEGLYSTIRKTAGPGQQLSFYHQVRRSFTLSHRLELLMARTLIDAGEYAEAGTVLALILEKNQRLAAAHYWLAKIGERTRDWDVMELAAQKAVVRDPDNSEYRMLFSRALSRQHKYTAAEKEMDRVISLRDRPAAWHYSRRGWMRWRQGNYQGALEDWQEANRLQPGNPGYYELIGRAYRKLGREKLAMVAYTSALARDPDNEKYKKELTSMAGP
ncbi:MAG: tetratricopeptide repeat protein [Desulfobacterales bacterium]|nr:tetratricopeptide repeat protein [Desulfobacterales bacterium]